MIDLAFTSRPDIVLQRMEGKCWNSTASDAEIIARFEQFIGSGMSLKLFMRHLFLPYGMNIERVVLDTDSTKPV